MTISNATLDDQVQLVDRKAKESLTEASERSASVSLPQWVEAYRDHGNCEWGEILQVEEWKEDGGVYRSKNGWQGRDLIHDVEAPVRVLQYYVHYGISEPLEGFTQGGVGTKLTGIVHFTKRAESHAGYCHGGSMTSVMDDVIGWAGFLVTGSCLPWSGYTVQINTSLKQPIRVNSFLLVEATIVQVERRKVSIQARLFNPEAKEGEPGSKAVHATCEGLVIINRGVLGETFSRSSSVLSSASSGASSSAFTS